MTTQESIQSQYAFKAEIKQLLHILVHSLYKDRDIFLRELISNASDALTRIQFELLTNRDVLDPDAEIAMHIEAPETKGDAPKQLIIKDSGIGMTREELITNLGTIAQSGAREFLAKLGAGQLDSADLIGQFGVGFYSVFMVADEVRVISRSYLKDAPATAWVSDGGEQFRIEPAEKSDRGTEVHITLKSDASEFAQLWKLRQVVKKHSDFVRFPIYAGGEQANQQTSLWRKNPSDVPAEDYKKFYQQLTLDYEEPLATIHFTADAPVNVRALLFIPARREKGFLAARKDPGLLLYSHNVLIQEYCTDLLPPWLGFVDGVVDSEDLPLNVSRETVQNNRVMKQLAKTIRSRVLRELKQLAERDTAQYNQFWSEFGRAFREAIATDPDAKGDVLPLFRHYSSQSNGELTSLDQYIGRMQEGQKEIYYVLGDDVKSVVNSPHLDLFRARKLEVMYWIDPLDTLIAPRLGEYREKAFRNVDSAELELPETKEEDKTEEQVVSEPDINRLIDRCVRVLGERIKEVRVSKVLKDSPVRLVSSKDEKDHELQRISRFLAKEYHVPRKVMEINRLHPLIADLARLAATGSESELLDLSIEQLYDSALVQEGLHPNPAEMLPRIQRLLALAASKES
jgi:molecular chaperone HtpG